MEGIKEIIHVTKTVKPHMDTNKGVYQAIGYKEFESFYELVKDSTNIEESL